MSYDFRKFVEARNSKHGSMLMPQAIEWVESTWEDPEQLYEELFIEYQRVTGLALTSSLSGQYDFYCDAIVQHLGSNKTALSFVKADGAVDDWSYEKLHKCVNYQVQRWNGLELHPGDQIVIASPLDETFFVAYFTALRLGLKICYLPTETQEISSAHLLFKLYEAQPKAVITPHSKMILEEHIELILLEDLPESDNNYSPTSHAYAQEEIVHVNLTVYYQDFHHPHPSNAKTSYLHALRDGIMLFHLKPGITICDPVSSLLSHQPYLALSALLCGARLVLVSDHDLKANPELLKPMKIHVLGVSKKLQELWTYNTGMPTGSLKHLYKSPFNQDLQAWLGFKQTNKIEKLPTANLLIDNAGGGVTLFSKPSPEMPDNFLLPNIGTSWALYDMNDSGALAIDNYGVFESNRHKSNLFIAKINSEYVISSSVVPAHHGKPYPSEHVECAVNALQEFEQCIIYSVPTTGQIASNTFLLIVFTGPVTQDVLEMQRSKWIEDIEFRIERLVGKEHVPDKIEFVPFIPQLKDGMVDRNWACAQYSRGLFHKKRQLPIYQTLGQLQKLAKG